MKTDIILAGVGGQGILSIAAVIGTAAIESGLYVKQAEVHGMSQRGGAVQSHLRISEKPVHSDLIPAGNCDLILSVEPMEALRYVPFLRAEGWIVSNSRPFINIPDYPDEKKLLESYAGFENSLLVDADTMAAEMGSRKVSNIIVLGAAVSYLGLSQDSIEKAIRMIFGRKGEDVVQMNLDALNAGLQAAGKIQSSING